MIASSDAGELELSSTRQTMKGESASDQKSPQVSEHAPDYQFWLMLQIISFDNATVWLHYNLVTSSGEVTPVGRPLEVKSEGPWNSAEPIEAGNCGWHPLERQLIPALPILPNSLQSAVDWPICVATQDPARNCNLPSEDMQIMRLVKMRKSEGEEPSSAQQVPLDSSKELPQEK